MGIKGIYGEIGSGERVALTKLAVDKYEETGRPFRIAIDIAIWQYQIQAGRGGPDPATRILYYRLLRLVSSSVQPLFVFDGPNKPPFKRNKRTCPGGGSVSNMLTKQLIKYFGFPYHQAPGEAEAECALLQQNGIVDAVLSEDVDTLMFGSDFCLRNWSSEGPKGNKSPTHVSVYSRKTILEKYGLDRKGMILVALMSGGDYNTEGIPGCGIKLACEAAKAGFGDSLCAILKTDTAGYKSWREDLAREILTNEGKFFKTKRKVLKIPENFPDRVVLSYYTHPVVSNISKIMKLKEEIQWQGEVDVIGLRHFVAEAFEWTYRPGAIKFIRGLAPALLVQKLLMLGEIENCEYDDIILTAMNETEIVRGICGRRVHFSTDGVPELRLIYHPLNIVGLDLDTEEEPPKEFDRDGLALHKALDKLEQYNSDEDDKSENLERPNRYTYDPTLPDKIWVARTIARIGVPLKVEDYEESLRDPEKFLTAKAATKRASAKTGLPNETRNPIYSNPNASKASKGSLQQGYSKSPSYCSHVDPNPEKKSRSSSSKLRQMTISSKVSKATGTLKTSIVSKNTTTKTKLKVNSSTKDTIATSSRGLANINLTKLPYTKISKYHIDKSKPIEKYKSQSPVFDLTSNNHSPCDRGHLNSKFQSTRKITDDSIKIFDAHEQDSIKTKLSVYEFAENYDISNDSDVFNEPLVSKDSISSSKIKAKHKSPEFPEISDLLLKHKKGIQNQGPINNLASQESTPNLKNMSPLLKTAISPVDYNETNCKISVGYKAKKQTEAPSTCPTQSPRRNKKIIILRESLPGTWKLVDANENQFSAPTSRKTIKSRQEKSLVKAGKSSGCWRMSEIECLDMSEN